MTLEQFITKYTGQIVGSGECGDLVRAYWNEVEHITPPSYPSAKDFWYNPAPPYIHTATPQPGDIAVYDAHGAFTDGHIAVYVGPTVFEQNADPDGSPAHVYNRANTYLLGYLTKENVMDDDDITAMYLAAGKSEADANLPANHAYYLAKKPAQLANDLYKSQTADKFYYYAVNYVPDVTKLQAEVAAGGGTFTAYTGAPLFVKKGK